MHLKTAGSFLYGSFNMYTTFHLLSGSKGSSHRSTLECRWWWEGRKGKYKAKARQLHYPYLNHIKLLCSCIITEQDSEIWVINCKMDSLWIYKRKSMSMFYFKYSWTLPLLISTRCFHLLNHSLKKFKWQFLSSFSKHATVW